MRDIANRGAWEAKSALSSQPWPRSYRASPNTRRTGQDLADFRRLLGDVAVESLTADHVRKYLVRLPNRLLFLSKRSEVRPFSAPLADEFLGEDSYGGIGIGWLFLIDRAKASREARIAA